MPRFERVLRLCALAIGALLVSCESQREREERVIFEKSEADLERLLETRACEDCQIYRAELAGKDLRGITLRRSVLDGNLRNADLRGAQMFDSGLGGDLRGVNLRGAHLNDVQLTPGEGLMAGARLDGLDLHTVAFADYTSWNYAVLRGTNLQDVSFAGHRGPHGRGDPRHPLDAPTGGATMRGVDLRDSNLRGAWLRQSDLTNADLRGADLQDANLPPAEDITGAKLEGAIAPNGLPCLGGSVGKCITKQGAQPPWERTQRRR